MMKVTKQPSTKQSLSEDENSTSRLFGGFFVHFLKNSTQKHPNIKQHNPMSQKKITIVKLCNNVL